MYAKLNLRKQPEHGLTLIELLIFIVIVGIAATAILGVFGSLTRNSASMLPDKQAQAIAASMLQEVLAQPFTFCDPDDVQVTTALSATIGPTGCASQIENMGPEGETRNGPTPFDNVNDYHNLAGPVALPNQTPATGETALGIAYNYLITVVTINPPLPNVTATPDDALLITVVVTGPNGVTARLQGVRIRYAPNKT